jgi:methionyl-tRNA formyltransferase
MGLKIVFMGTPAFAVPCLDMLVKEGYEVAAVVTQPDKPKGRGNKLSTLPIKEYALNQGIEVLQPEKIRTAEFEAKIKDINPDLLVTVAYGKILPKTLLDIPDLGCINVHGSILPKYRGAAPIHWAIINGEKETGITTMYTDIGTDTGDMLLKKFVAITDKMTVGELHDQLSIVGAEVLKDTLIQLQNGNLKRTPQDNTEATYAPMIKKDTGLIGWNKASVDIHNLVRGTNPSPGAYTFYKGERMRIWATEVLNGFQSETKPGCMASSAAERNDQPGCIMKVDKDGLIISAIDGSIKITEIQFDSSKRMSVEEYIRGHRISEGEILG